VIESSDRTVSLGIRDPAAPSPVAQPLRWAFLLLVAALPLEAAHVDLLGWDVTWAKLAAVPFLVCYLWYHLPWPPRRSLPTLGPAVAWMGACVAVYGVASLMGRYDYSGPRQSRPLDLLQLWVFLWVVSDLLEDAALARRAMLAYALGATTWAIGILFWMPGLSVTYVESRLSSLGYNPNYLGVFMALGAVIVIGTRLDAPPRPRLVALGLLALALPLLTVVAGSGSRTAAVALTCGLALFLLPLRGARRPTRASVWTAVGAGALLLVLVVGSHARGHWTSTWRGFEARGRIARVSAKMVLERPLLGWGGDYSRELGARMGRRPYEPHNLVLQVLVEGGILGATPFLISVALCAWGAVRKLAGPLGRLPLAVLATMVVANMADPLVLTKSFWLALALGAAPGDGHR
jgi:O-antigen ligase